MSKNKEKIKELEEKVELLRKTILDISQVHKIITSLICDKLNCEIIMDKKPEGVRFILKDKSNIIIPQWQN